MGILPMSHTAILAVFFAADRGRMPLILTGKMPVLRCRTVLIHVLNGVEDLTVCSRSFVAEAAAHVAEN